MARGVTWQILSFYVGSRDVWRAAGYCLVLVAVLVACAIALSNALPQASGQEPAEAKAKSDDRDRKAKAALALAGAGDPAKCECAAGKVKTWKEAAELASKQRVPVVVFAGVQPRCCGGAIPVKMTVEEAKLLNPERPIVVYTPTADGKMLQATDLPADAPREVIKKSVELAQKQIDAKP